MSEKGRVTQSDVAARANVHITTVSLALRNSPRLPEATRDRIQKLAEEMGYCADPMLSALTAYRRNAKLKQHQGTLAWITPDKMGKFPEYQRGAQERCAELGYKLDSFVMASSGVVQLTRVLRARNIVGLLLAPQQRNRAHLHFSWEDFSSVTFGHTLVHPQLHMVTSAQFRIARLCVRGLRARGYRRIGFVSTQNSDERTDQNFSSGYYAEQGRFKESEKIPALILRDASAEQEQEDFATWYRTYQPDAVAVHYNRVAEYMQNLGITYQECALATTARSDKPHDLAGVYQNDIMVGRTAVDILEGMIHRNERGIPKIPLRILVPGTWMDGFSVERKVGRALKM